MRTLTIVVIAALLLLAGCGGGPGDSSRGADTTKASAGETTGPTSGLRTVTIDASGGEKVKIRVEIADTPAEQEKGLMFRKSLGKDRGMLFVFPDEQVRSFWMKNTLIPLSIAYIDSDGRIIDLQEMKALDDQPPHYVSAGPARYALEANKGYFEEHGVKVGARAELPE
ncbi:MAG TPA: DUF192 domain-containing protein [Rubrobacteraceae bacterium]|nr:DUF192 domain-containing protein [Rubrobacteraceae bacterium]